MIRAVEIVRQVAPGCNAAYLAAFEAGDPVLAQFAVVTPLRLGHFLAQVLYETGGGTVTFENMNYRTAERLLQIFGVGNHSAAIRPEEVAGLLGNPQALAERVYGLGNPPKAAELGNTRPGDGYLFRGGGMLQTTGGGNYKNMGDRIGVDLYGQPALIVAAANALLPALHEWADGNLNEAADNNDIRIITRTINGGYNGLDGRQLLFNQIFPIANGGGAAPPPPADDSSTSWLQTSLNTLGATPPLTVDGDLGPGTTAAVRWFQGIAGLTVDGVAGPATRAAIRQRLTA